ncbi:MAG: PAS domain S-box protein, partial [Chitinophagaceae bacterium]
MNPSEIDVVVNSVLRDKYVPSSVVINRQMEIIQFRGDTSFYLRHADGKASLNILKMARLEIAIDLRKVIVAALEEKKKVQKVGIEIAKHNISVTIEAIPLPLKTDESVLLVLFTQKEIGSLEGVAIKTRSSPDPGEQLVNGVETELARYREELLSTRYTYDATMEELQAANEELMSSNEELRSINEQLEASKIVLEKANRELVTTNRELHAMNRLLNESYKFSEEIISTIHDPMIILDKDLRVKTANRSFYRRFNLSERDTEGVLLYDLAKGHWNIPKLRELLNEIVTENTSFTGYEMEQTFPGIGHIIMRINAKRIIQQAHREQLILVAIADITEVMLRQRGEKQRLELEVDSQTKLASASKMADQYIRGIFMQAPVSIVILKGPSFIIDLVNREAIETWGVAREKAVGRPFFEVSPEFREDGLDRIMQQVYHTGEPFNAKDFRVPDTRNNIRTDRFFSFSLNPIRDLDGIVTGLTAIGIDVTQEVTARRRIERQSQELELAVQQRTKELNGANEELAAMNSVLQKVNKELESFAYVSSHDLQE